eukprot:4753414-Pleurochrysis_carterae.AAC.2
MANATLQQLVLCRQLCVFPCCAFVRGLSSPSLKYTVFRLPEPVSDPILKYNTSSVVDVLRSIRSVLSQGSGRQNQPFTCEALAMCLFVSETAGAAHGARVGSQPLCFLAGQLQRGDGHSRCRRLDGRPKGEERRVAPELVLYVAADLAGAHAPAHEALRTLRDAPHARVVVPGPP